MTYATQAALATDATFRATVKMSLVTTARSLLSQVKPPDELATVTQKRRDLALKILSNPDSLIETATWALASVPTITGSSTDAQVQSAVNSLLTTLTS